MFDSLHVIFAFAFCAVLAVIGTGHFIVALTWAFRLKHPVSVRLRKVMTNLFVIAWYVVLTTLLATPVAVVKLLTVSPYLLTFLLLMVCLPSFIVPRMANLLLSKVRQMAIY